MNLCAWRKYLPVLLPVAALYLAAGCDHTSVINESTANVKHITQGDFEAEVTRCTNTVVAEFYATWSGPSRQLAPIVDHLAGGYAGQLKFIKINVDESPGLAQNFQAAELPLLIVFKDGKVAARFHDLPAEVELKTRLDPFVSGR